VLILMIILYLSRLLIRPGVNNRALQLQGEAMDIRKTISKLINALNTNCRGKVDTKTVKAIVEKHHCQLIDIQYHDIANAYIAQIADTEYFISIAYDTKRRYWFHLLHGKKDYSDCPIPEKEE
jgi:hypothetical protein